MPEATRSSASAPCGKGAAGSLDYQALSVRALETGLAEVPGYESWRRLDPGPQTPIDVRYAAMPVLTKQELRDGGPGWFTPRGKDVQTGLSAGDVVFAQTSGSTDDQVTIVFNVPWWEASECAAWSLNDHARRLATGSHREAVIASPRCVGPGCIPRPRPMTERIIGRHLYLNQKINPVWWTAAEIRRMADELKQWSPVLLEGDPAYLAVFARRAAELGLELFQPQLIFLTYSFPSRIYLRQIRQVFGAPIASSYGSTETGHVFMECEAGRLHQNTEQCRVDFQPWLARYGGPLRGRMLVTVFDNPWFSVLHFDIGDVARLDDRGPCPCGRSNGLTLASIDGRTKDVSFTADGRAITVDDIDAALAKVEGLNAWQLDLPSPGISRMHIMAEPAAAERTRIQVREVLESIYGSGMKYEVTVEATLQHEPSGKFRFARASFPVDHSVLWKAE
jgi:phenylacetate-CoA ligase